MSVYTNEQLTEIRSLVKQINFINEQLCGGLTDSVEEDFPEGNSFSDDWITELNFVEHTNPPYVALVDTFSGDYFGKIDHPLTQLRDILSMMKENIDLVDAVDIVKVREALRLLEYHRDAGNLDDEEEIEVTEVGLTALERITRKMVGRFPIKKREPEVEL